MDGFAASWTESYRSNRLPLGASDAVSGLRLLLQMGRKPRHLPESAYGRSLAELTTRTIQGRYLLRPSGTLNQIAIGILARAQKLSGAQVMLSPICPITGSLPLPSPRLTRWQRSRTT